MLMYSPKKPHQMTQSEFIDHWLGKYHITKTERPTSFTEWAKNSGITIPRVDYGKVFGMAMLNNKTRSQKGKWRTELSAYAAYSNLFERYKQEVAEREILVLADEKQLAVLHKRKVRLALLRNNKSVSREILKDYPDLIGGNKTMKCPKCSKQHDVPDSKIPYHSNEGCFLCPDCGTPLERSSDMIHGISADRVLIDDVEQTFLANELQRDKIKQAVIDTIGSDRPFMSVPDIAEEITQNVMEIIEQNTQGACEYCGTPVNSPNYAYHICASAKKEVVVTVTGGVADVDEIPPGIIVKIRDYDIEGCDEDRLMQDKEGNRYVEAVFTEDDTHFRWR